MNLSIKDAVLQLVLQKVRQLQDFPAQLSAGGAVYDRDAIQRVLRELVDDGLVYCHIMHPAVGHAPGRGRTETWWVPTMRAHDYAAGVPQ